MFKKNTYQRLFFTLITMLFFSSLVFSSSINFISVDYPTAAQKGMEEDKFFFVNFSADWCATCEIMEETANAHLELTDYISEKFIAVKANVDSEIGKDWMQRFDVSCLPTLIVFSSNAEEVARSSGGITASEFLFFLKNFRSSKPATANIYLDSEELIITEDQSDEIEDDVYNGATLHPTETFTNVESKITSDSQKQSFIDNNALTKNTNATFLEEKRTIHKTVDTKKYGIQVGMYAELKNANRKIEKMKKQSSQIIFLRQEKVKNRLLYQVVVGGYAIEGEAKD